MEREISIKTEGLTKVYTDFWGRPRVRALHNLDLKVEKGEIFGLLGPNGSGKTTTVKLLLGLLFPTSGRAWVLGEPAGNVHTYQRIGFLPEESYFYRFLNAEETLHFYGQLFEIPGKERKKKVEELIDLVGLSEARKRRIGEYSKGMARRIGLAHALINDPEVIFLDEPTSGLDPIGSREIKDLVLELARRGKTVLLCSHLLADVEDVCDKVAILHKGSLVKIGAVKELLTIKHIVQIAMKDPSEKTLEEIKAILKRERTEITGLTHPTETLEELFLETIEKLRMPKTLTIARHTFKEALRKKILLVLGLFFLTLVVSSLFMEVPRPEDRIKMVVRISFGSMAFFGVIAAIFLSATSLPNEIEEKQIYTVMTKPIGRTRFLFGKILGLVMVIGLLLGLMTIFSLALVHFLVRGETLVAKRLLSARSLSFSGEGIVKRGEVSWLTGAKENKAIWYWKGLNRESLPPQARAEATFRVIAVKKRGTPKD